MHSSIGHHCNKQFHTTSELSNIRKSLFVHSTKKIQKWLHLGFVVFVWIGMVPVLVCKFIESVTFKIFLCQNKMGSHFLNKYFPYFSRLCMTKFCSTFLDMDSTTLYGDCTTLQVGFIAFYVVCAFFNLVCALCNL